MICFGRYKSKLKCSADIVRSGRASSKVGLEGPKAGGGTGDGADSEGSEGNDTIGCCSNSEGPEVSNDFNDDAMGRVRRSLWGVIVV